MKTKEYQGWASYETWNIMLFLNNDQSTYHEYRRSTRAYVKILGNKLLCRHAKAIAIECLGDKTADGVSLNSRNVKWSEIRDVMLESIDWLPSLKMRERNKKIKVMKEKLHG